VPDSPAESEEKGILKDVNGLIDSGLGLKIGKTPRHKNETSCRDLTKTPNIEFDASVLIADIYDQIGKNWDASRYHVRSEENWRWEKQKGIDANNDSPEVSLERAIVNIPKQIWADADCWINQVPVASGLVAPYADGGRIDLVHGCGDNAYEFIELKVGSDTPLYAAMEILKYGVLYIFCREDERTLKYVDRQRDLLQAKMIQLKVLAPAKFYEGYGLSWLEEKLVDGLMTFLNGRKSAFKMDFKFETLSLVSSRTPVIWEHP